MMPSCFVQLHHEQLRVEPEHPYTTTARQKDLHAIRRTRAERSVQSAPMTGNNVVAQKSSQADATRIRCVTTHCDHQHSSDTCGRPRQYLLAKPKAPLSTREERQAKMHRPGIEPGAGRYQRRSWRSRFFSWQRPILPLNHQCSRIGCL
jgi:hypothetical protein